MTTLKVYCTPAEKKNIEASAKAENLTTSKYLLQRGLSDLHERAMLTELIGCMIRLLGVESMSNSIQDDLLEIAQNVLEGSSIDEARALVADICKDADKGNQRPRSQSALPLRTRP